MEHYSQLTRVSYNIAAQKYHDLFKDELDYKNFDKRLLTKFAKLFDSQSKILDAGCGPSGHIGRFLFDMDLDVSGLDISDKCIEIASAYNPEMNFMRMDMSQMEMENGSIDGIVSYYSIIHAPKAKIHRYFEEFNRVLVKGGKLLLSVKTGDTEEYINDFMGDKIDIYFTCFSIKEIKHYLIESGFKVLLLEERSPYPDEINVKRIFALGEKLSS
jgi:ubiquinone/menaquinone biosynthesis C-methylase UbiE